MKKQSHRIVILGASRGLGWATYQTLNQKYSESEFLLVSRKIQNNQVSENTKKITQDFSKNNVDADFFNQITEFNPTEIIYCAGGGPYGSFENKKWSDHEWALNVNFLYPAQLIHQVLNQKINQNRDQKNKFQDLKLFVCVGSVIAENKPDPSAASYAAAKHALRGLVTTLQIENKSSIQFKLFSPGYMNTDMLPANSLPRIENKSDDPVMVAKTLVDFIESDQLHWADIGCRTK